MCEIKKGSIVKLNPIIFTYEERKEKYCQRGNLSYPSLILEWDFKVLDLFKDAYHGEMMSTEVLNDDRVEPGTVVYMVVRDMLLIKE